ncbi:MAG: 16S rRNA (cytosine(1402)-N(4))-methyltransferase RsmH [bacterium]|nr:16S rRNA (cytosine(1402)-N(4))-methyltransferase RsmH [bacterium]
MTTHTPVLIKEVLQYLDVQPNENVIDCTVGEGGHTKLLLEKNGPVGKVLGIDLDAAQVENSKLALVAFGERAVLVNDSYANIKNIVERTDFTPVHGILLDLGMSSWQLEKSTRGFSFLRDEGLDMRYSLKSNLTAQTIVNEYPEAEIERILREYGEERFSRQIATKIGHARQSKRVKSTFELRSIIQSAIPPEFRHGKIHVATRTFQALRIAVNKELDNLTAFLPQAISLLYPGGRLVVMSFHSLEDRIVKNFFKDQEHQGIIKVLTKKPITGSEQEVEQNPRARSTKLRAIIKL